MSINVFLSARFSMVITKSTLIVFWRRAVPRHPHNLLLSRCLWLFVARWSKDKGVPMFHAFASTLWPLNGRHKWITFCSWYASENTEFATFLSNWFFTFVFQKGKIEVGRTARINKAIEIVGMNEWAKTQEQQRRKKLFSRLIAQSFGLPTDRPSTLNISHSQMGEQVTRGLPEGQFKVAIRSGFSSIPGIFDFAKESRSTNSRAITVYGMAGANSDHNKKLSFERAEGCRRKTGINNERRLESHFMNMLQSNDQTSRHRTRLVVVLRQWISIWTQFWLRRGHAHWTSCSYGDMLLVISPTQAPGGWVDLSLFLGRG